jgi:hypothetical protein
MLLRAPLIAAALGVVATAAIVEAPHAKADPPPNCNVTPWGILGIKKREMRRADPTGRLLDATPDHWVPAHYENPGSSCSSGQYYSNCTYYPGGWVDDQISDNETYPVTAGTVLPDEPGHMPDPAPAPAPAPAA